VPNPPSSINNAPMNGYRLITTIPGRDFRFAKAPLASKFAPGEFVIFSGITRKTDIARWAALLQASSYGGAGNIARWAGLLRMGSFQSRSESLRTP